MNTAFVNIDTQIYFFYIIRKGGKRKMKSKIKRHSRSILAVILTISMLISTMMVGLIATDAARVADDDEVSWNSSTDRLHIRIGSTWYDKYFNSAGVTTFEVPSDNTTIEFELNFNGTVYKLDSSQANFTAKGIRSTAGQTRLAKTSGSSTYTVSGVYQGTYTATLDGTPSNGKQKLKISEPGGGDDPTTSGLYLFGEVNGTTNWNNGNGTAAFPMTLDSTDESNGYRYYTYNFDTTNTQKFRFWDGKYEFSPQSNITDDPVSVSTDSANPTEVWNVHKTAHFKVDPSDTAKTLWARYKYQRLTMIQQRHLRL